MPRRSMLLAGLALLPSLSQGSTTANPPLTTLYSGDVPNPQCTPMQMCILTGFPTNRGFCISTTPSGNNQPASAGSSTNACWDVCNPDHEPSAYTVNGNGPNDVMNHVSQGMIAQVREGLNNNVSCPSALGLDKQTDICPVGEDCPDNMRKLAKIPAGQGMCVVDGHSSTGRSCFNKCDFNIPVSRFGEGAQRGASDTVTNYRNSGSCTAKPWLPWLIGILVLAALGLCAWILYVNVIKNRPKLGGFGKNRPGSDFTKDASEEMIEDMQDRGLPQEEYPEEYEQRDDDYGPAPPAVQERGLQERSFQAEPRAPVPDYRSGSMDQQMPASPNAGFRIPGLDAPQLQMPNMQQLIVPGQGAPLMPNLSSTSASGGPQAYRTAPASPTPNFQTQLPTFTSASMPQVGAPGAPPFSGGYGQPSYPSATSMQMQPGAFAAQPQAMPQAMPYTSYQARR